MTLVRPLRRDDEAHWRRLWRDYLAFYETTRPEAIYDAYFERLLSDDPREYAGLVAEVDGVPRGIVHFLFHRHGWRLEDVCYLQDLYADPDLRGRGLGRALIEAVYAAADARGAPAVYWLTQDYNTAARRLYDRVAQVTPFIKYERAL